jgi:crossover junction endodeoxyribonuclease RuvC
MNSGQLILGIDPGTNIMGYCLLRYDGRQYDILKIGCLRLTKCESHLEKLQGIVDFMTQLLSEHKPTVLAIEEPFFGKNVQSMLKLGRAQGAVMSIAMQHKIEIVEITPRRVKQAVTGKGSASKEQVAAMVARIADIDISSLNADATDAAAIAISYTLNKIKKVTPGVGAKKSKSSWDQFMRENPEKVIR